MENYIENIFKMKTVSAPLKLTKNKLKLKTKILNENLQLCWDHEFEYLCHILHEF